MESAWRAIDTGPGDFGPFLWRGMDLMPSGCLCQWGLPTRQPGQTVWFV